MKKNFYITWDKKLISKDFKINEKDVHEYFTDGRRVSFLIERRLKWDHPGWELAKSEGAGYDLKDPNKDLWEVRSITRNGVYFTPSNQVGSGRIFNENDFKKKLSNIKGFILTDIEQFPRMEVFVVSVENVIRWYSNGLLGKNAKISREKFLTQLSQNIA